jgi:GalNAc-alpha-(1->4)-GalNAc-alpha-(1->3)-diNAcBac-PP-undecaprenol alpha-1,4-N-acetyl-D-galactosaminyltransferase
VQELFFHNSLLEFVKKRFIYYLAANFYKKANAVIGNSKNLSKDWSKIINRTVRTIYPITEITTSKKTISNQIRLTWIGRNSPEKNISDFINCLEYLNLNKYKINIITDKIDKKEINIKILKAVKFYSFVNDKKKIESYYKDTDILVSTSYYEGFPNVVAEAINYNCLIVASKNYGGIYDLIKNRNYGIFYEIGNAKELAKKINSIKLFSKSTLKKIKLAKQNLKSIATKHNKDFENLFINKKLI